LFEVGRESRLYDQNQPAQLAAQLRRLLTDSACAAAQASAARQRLWEDHTAEEQAADVLAWTAGRQRRCEPIASETAFRAFTQVLDRGHHDLWSALQQRVTLAESAAQSGQFDRAIQMVETMVQSYPGVAGLQRLLARLHVRAGDEGAASAP